ncbi:MAG: hypothetical protein DRO11_01795 [Methanobacteriota archaeon]|nr:MAG: hypothetical protein DRO11_01795 [Euryarchaeota archaeon]
MVQGTKTWDTSYLLILTTLFLPLYLVGIHPHLGLWGDNAAYLILSRATWSGEGYRLVSHPLDPLCGNWPPGLPLLLSVSGWLPLEQHILAAKLLISLLGVGCILLVYSHHRHTPWAH